MSLPFKRTSFLLEFSHIKLLILDECHQAIRDHAYGSIIKQYKTLWDRQENQNQLPRLFSITTALLKTHCTSTQLKERIENLHHFFWYFKKIYLLQNNECWFFVF